MMRTSSRRTSGHGRLTPSATTLPIVLDHIASNLTHSFNIIHYYQSYFICLHHIRLKTVMLNYYYYEDVMLIINYYQPNYRQGSQYNILIYEMSSYF